MDQKTGNSYISGTLTDTVEIPTANSGFSMMTSLIKDETNDCDNDLLTLAPKTSILPFPVVGHCRNHLATYSGLPWSKIPDVRLGPIP